MTEKSVSLNQVGVKARQCEQTQNILHPTCGGTGLVEPEKSRLYRVWVGWWS